MKYDYITPYQIIAITGIINFVVMCTIGWVIAGTIISAILLLIVAIPLWRSWRKRRKPFNIEHTRETGLAEIPNRNGEIIEKGNVFQNAKDWLPDKEVLLLEVNEPNIIGIEFKARTQRHITRVAIRFVSDRGEKPITTQFSDVNQEALALDGYREYEGGEGVERVIKYTQPLFVSNKKASDYLAKVVTKGIWKGKISVIVQMEEQDEYIRSIPCEVK